MSTFNLIEGDVIIRDENGNPVGVVLDGSVYRLQTSTKLRNPGDTAYMGDATTPVRTDPTGTTRQPVGVHDTTNGPAAVKPASTAPVDADQALVVVLSPNQQAIPVTTTPATALAGISTGTVLLSGGSSGSLNPVRGTTYNEQTSNAQRSISSSSANDTSAGTGARTVRITYYTSTGDGPFTETVTLNGMTAVNTASTNICFIERMVVITAGSIGFNAGTITLHVSTGGGGGTIGTIGVGNIVAAVGDNQTLWAHHYVPSGRSANITGISVGASAPSTFHLRARDIGVANAAERVVSGFLTTTAAIQRNYGSPIIVQGPARILMYGVPSTNNVTLNSSFDFFEET